MSQAATTLQTTVKAATRKRRVPLGSICNNIVVVKRQRQRPPECSFSKKRCPDWSSTHYDVFENILKYLPLPDILRCRAVCTTWHSSTKTYISSSHNSFTSLQLQRPPLLLWYDPPYNDGEYYNWFLDITRPRKNLYHINQKSKRLLRRRMGCCVGFSQGWFLFLGKRRTDRLYLFHPLLFSTAVARFPRIKTPNGDSCKDVSKAVLLSDPISTTTDTGGGCGGLIVIHGSYSRLLYAKCGATQFSELEYQGDGNDPIITRWEDIICFGSCLYGIATTDNGHRHMFAWDCTVGDTKPRKILDFRVDFKHPGGHHSCRWSFLRLVESQGELLLVCIHVPDPSTIPKIMQKHDFDEMHDIYSLVRRPDMCLVYKMDFKEKEWVRMDSLGDHRALFIMEFQARSLSTHEFPQYKSNSIYFKHAIYYPGCSPVVGVYNLEDGSMEEIEVLWW